MRPSPARNIMRRRAANISVKSARARTINTLSLSLPWSPFVRTPPTTDPSPPDTHQADTCGPALSPAPWFAYESCKGCARRRGGARVTSLPLVASSLPQTRRDPHPWGRVVNTPLTTTTSPPLNYRELKHTR